MKNPRMSKESLRAARKAKDAKRMLKEREKAGYRIIDGIEFPPGAIPANWDALRR